jgi:alpha-glucosidase
VSEFAFVTAAEPNAVDITGAPVPLRLTSLGPGVTKLSLGTGERFSFLDDSCVIEGEAGFSRLDRNSAATALTSFSLDAKTGVLSFGGPDRAWLRLPLAALVAEPRFRLRFVNVGEQHFYGLGQYGLPLDRLGTVRRLYNSHINHGAGGDISIPLMLSNKGYGLFFDNARFALIDSGKSHNDICFEYEAEPGAFDLYLVAAENLRQATIATTGLLGRPTMPPRWSLGFMQSTRHFDSPEELAGLADELRARELPCDTIIFLSTYTDGKGWNTAVGTLDYEPAVLPDPKALFDKFRSQNFQYVSHEYPVVHMETPLGAEAAEKGYVLEGGYRDNRPVAHPSTQFFEGQRFIDFENPEAARWWWDAHRHLVADGVAAWWLDGGEGPTEPAILSRPRGEGLHNRFDLFRQRAFAEGEARDNPDRRPLLLCRSGGPGMQRYGAGTWSGDINVSWAVFAAQACLGLNMGMSGVTMWGTDIGGFHKAIPYTGELFVRWFQFGAFNSIFRAHGHTWRMHVPWAYGDTYTDICREVLHLRYRLLPYIYSLAYEAHRTGLAFIRPLILDHPDDPQCFDRSREFMFGDDLLVAPVTDDQARQWSVYLPEGSWTDFWTGEVFEGGRSHLVDAPLERIPLFVRAGAVIPTGPVVQHLSGYAPERIELMVNPGAVGVFSLYEDDGLSNRYRQGEHAITRLGLSGSDKAVEIRVEAPEGGSSVIPSARTYAVRLWLASDPKSVRDSDGKAIGFTRAGPFVIFELGAAPARARVEFQ